LGDIRLKDLRPEHIERFIVDLKHATWRRNLPIKSQEIEAHPLSVRRINMVLIRLRQVLNLAYERRLLDQDPKGWVKLQREEKPDINPLSLSEQRAFLEAVDPRWKPYFSFSLGTGARPSEQVALEWWHIDYAHNKTLIGRQYVKGRLNILKTRGSTKDIDMLPPIKDTLLKLKSDKKSLVFPNAVGGHLDLSNMRNRIWYPALEKAGLDLREMYQCRHSFASVMLEAGESPAWVSKMLGYTSMRMLFERYGRFIRDRTGNDGRAYTEMLNGGNNGNR